MKTTPKINPVATNPAAGPYARTQLSILDELRDAIRRGGEAGLEPLVWAVGFTGWTGEIDNITHGTEKARAMFDAWIGVLGAERVKNFPPNEHGDTSSTAQVGSDRPNVFGLTLRLNLSGWVTEDEREGTVTA